MGLRMGGILTIFEPDSLDFLFQQRNLQNKNTTYACESDGTELKTTIEIYWLQGIHDFHFFLIQHFEAFFRPCCKTLYVHAGHPPFGY